MKTNLILPALLATALAASAAPVAPPDDKAAFAQLKSLAGTWRGHSDCQGAKTATVIYRVISAGSTVMETLNPGTKMEMVSMYHLDREGELVMTHYCSAGNQPQMEYDAKHSSPSMLVLKFDGGDVNPKQDMHVHSGTIHILGKNKIESDWSAWKDGKPLMTSHISLKRVE